MEISSQTLHQYLAKYQLYAKPFEYFSLEASSPIIPKVVLFILMPLAEKEHSSLLTVSSYGIIGIVQKGKALDQALFDAFQDFLLSGYMRFNHWWQHAVYDRPAKYGLLVKEGSIHLAFRQAKVQNLFPIHIISSTQTTILIDKIALLEKEYQTRLSIQQDFGKQIEHKLGIKIVPRLSEVSKGHLYLIGHFIQPQGTSDASTHLIKMLLASILCAYNYPELQKFQITTRINTLEIGHYVLERSQVYQLLVPERDLSVFMDQYFIFSKDDIELKPLPLQQKFGNIALLFVQNYLKVMDEYAHPIDK